MIFMCLNIYVFCFVFCFNFIFFLMTILNLVFLFLLFNGFFLFLLKKKKNLPLTHRHLCPISSALLSPCASLGCCHISVQCGLLSTDFDFDPDFFKFLDALDLLQSVPFSVSFLLFTPCLPWELIAFGSDSWVSKAFAKNLTHDHKLWRLNNTCLHCPNKPWVFSAYQVTTCNEAEVMALGLLGKVLESSTPIC